MTPSGPQMSNHSEALQSDPTNACGSLLHRKADHVEKRDPRGGNDKANKNGA